MNKIRQPAVCLICGASDAKYKFKCCRRMFCSTKCFSEHDACGSELNETEVKSVIPERRCKRIDNNDLNLTEEDVLSDDMLAAVRKDSELNELLRNCSMQRLLCRLDTARDRRVTFSKLYESHTDFAEVVDRITTVLVKENVL